MPKPITLNSPAKLNLFLKVQNKRPDGFHNIVTVFQRIDLCDELTFTDNSHGKIKIICFHPHVPTGRKNMIYKAIQLVQGTYGIKRGVTVRVKKRIPVAAGLAGGSSNAATTLMALNRLWNLDLKTPQLVRLARQIGSDVAFFLYDTSWALGTRRGDVIKPLNIKTRLTHVLVVPCVKLYASKVYGALKIKLTKRSDNVNILIRNLSISNIKIFSSLMINDLETAIFRLKPNLLKLKQKLKLLDTQGVMISGSGPAVFALMKNAQQARRLKTRLARIYSQVFVVRTF
ncbi:MAG TPA: 4-(cytidine 5'-diphospho)-2-C-methyl-D-erythritol kinase [Candidatus Omnitrophota bacterium]|nr:4-(cytidine 5'-diphospho)-2-C-methyl-D-erythritol kinase [Candidatus Omnitrophota bacterium]